LLSPFGRLRLAALAVMLFAAKPILAQPAGDADAGRDAFAAQCKVCHGGAVAPSLRGVVGRPIASVADFPAYSDALKKHAGETWTEDGLSTFLKDPGAFAPGTRMMMAVPDDQARADIVAYLKALAAPKPD
jgi:cytochrome c2